MWSESVLLAAHRCQHKATQLPVWRSSSRRGCCQQPHAVSASTVSASTRRRPCPSCRQHGRRQDLRAERDPQEERVAQLPAPGQVGAGAVPAGGRRERPGLGLSSAAAEQPVLACSAPRGGARPASAVASHDQQAPAHSRCGWACCSPTTPGSRLDAVVSRLDQQAKMQVGGVGWALPDAAGCRLEQAPAAALGGCRCSSCLWAAVSAAAALVALHPPQASPARPPACVPTHPMHHPTGHQQEHGGHCEEPGRRAQVEQPRKGRVHHGRGAALSLAWPGLLCRQAGSSSPLV